MTHNTANAGQEPVSLDALKSDLQAENYLEFLPEGDIAAFRAMRDQVLAAIDTADKGNADAEEFELGAETEQKIVRLYEMRKEAKRLCREAVQQERQMNNDIAQVAEEQELTAEQKEGIAEIQNDVRSRASQVVQWIKGIFAKRDKKEELSKRAGEREEIGNLQAMLKKGGQSSSPQPQGDVL